MKHMKCILAVLLALLMLCGAIGASAEPALALAPEALLELEDGLDGDGLALDDAPGLWGIELDETGASVLGPEGMTGEDAGAPEAVANANPGDFNVEDGVLTHYRGTGGDVVIPGNLNIRTIGSYAFEDDGDLTSVVIPEGVVSIENGAFVGCGNLTSVTLPDSLDSIGDSAFENCDDLADIEFPNNLGVIGNSAFYGCSSLTSVSIPKNVSEIGAGAFSYCDSLKTIKVEEGSKSFTVLNGVLYRLSDAKPSEVINGLAASTSVVIPEGVKVIGESAFAGCAKLKSVSIPKGVTTIGKWAFLDCAALQSVEIPQGVKTIGGWAFFRCESLKAFHLPSSVKTVENAICSSCANLAKITVDESNKYIKAIDNVLYTLKDGNPYAVVSCATGNTKAVIPEGVVNIGYSAFCNCIRLESLRIPASVEFIDNWAISGCEKLTRIEVLSTNIKIDDDDAFNGTENATFYTVKGSNMADWAREHGYTVKADWTPAVELSKKSLALNVGQKHTLSVNNLAGRKVKWSSDNEKVATVSASGVVTAKGAGKCTVTAQVSGKALKCQVKVVKAKLSSKQLTVSSVDSFTVKLAAAAGTSATWKSSKSTVAKIVSSDAKAASLKALKPGSTVISAQIEGLKPLTCKVTVVEPLSLKYTTKGVVLTNHSGKKIKHVKFTLVQKDRNGKALGNLKCEYGKAIPSHSSKTQKVKVNSKATKFSFKSITVTFSDGSTWKK